MPRVLNASPYSKRARDILDRTGGETKPLLDGAAETLKR
jgi:hypothetical protein